jgi:hypothetical protein
MGRGDSGPASVVNGWRRNYAPDYVRYDLDSLLKIRDKYRRNIGQELNKFDLLLM